MEKEAPTKKCQFCIGKGRYLLKFDYQDVTLPCYVPCEKCKGSGQIELDEFEQQLEIESLKFGHHENY